MKITVKANAKINLLLDILGTLPNGYHDLYMLMQSVSLHDTVTVETDNSRNITLTCNIKDIPLDDSNTAVKAAKAFFEYTGKENPGIKIHLEKFIPHAAGLAGGSADAAGVLVALKRLFMPELTDRQLIEIGSTVGSDVPFCALGGTMVAPGTGTILTYLPNLNLENIVIVKPDRSVSTGKAYSAFDSAEKVRHLDKAGIYNAVIEKDYDGIYSRCDNVFEQFIFVPERVPIKAVMRKHNARCCCMSGSGPSIFGIFESAEDAEKAVTELKESFENTFLCRSTEAGVEESHE
ncbi:MAG: 4-(cytidine 5'-diphospho)-2-C-methyl-D-erythritol kinase [Acutalibacteraceae bacterium]